MSWSKEQVITLIDAYREKPCLYAVKNINYKNKHCRSDALDYVESKVKAVRPSTNIHEIKVKFNSLKATFLNEYRKYIKTVTSGSGEDEIYKPNLWYYDYMTFLLEHCSVRKAIDSLENQCSMDDSECTRYEEIIIETDEQGYDSQNHFSETEADAIKGDMSISKPTLPSEYQQIANCEDEISASSGSSIAYILSNNNVENKLPKKFKKRANSSAKEDTIIESASNVIKEVTNVLRTKNDLPQKRVHEDIFGEFVASRMKLIKDSDIKKKLEAEICNVIFKY